MTIPASNEIIEPLLKYLARKEKPVKLAKIIENLEEIFSLTQEEKDERVGSGGNRFRARVATALVKMKAIGLIAQKGHGYLIITDKGRERIGYTPQDVESSSDSTLTPVGEAQQHKADSDHQDDNFFREIVKLYLMKNEVKPEELPNVLESLRKSLNVQQSPASASPAPTPSTPSPTPSAPPSTTETTSEKPAVPIGESITEEHIVCLECGQKFSALKRHLGSHHQLTPGEYRAKWGLPPNYPMVVRKVSEKR